MIHNLHCYEQRVPPIRSETFQIQSVTSKNFRFRFQTDNQSTNHKARPNRFRVVLHTQINIKTKHFISHVLSTLNFFYIELDGDEKKLR